MYKEEAKKKLCPYVLCEKIIKDELGINIVAVVTVHNTFCVVSECMSWEWQEIPKYSEYNYSDIYGYCSRNIK